MNAPRAILIAEDDSPIAAVLVDLVADLGFQPLLAWAVRATVSGERTRVAEHNQDRAQRAGHTLGGRGGGPRPLAGLVALLLGCGALLLAGARPTGTAARPSLALGAAPAAITGLHVAGNRLVNRANEPVVLRGVDRSGTEFACVQDKGIFDGPNDATSVQAIVSWHTNAVRVPLSEDCWLAINGVDSLFSGTPYRRAIRNYVKLLNQNGLVVILDLHWTAPGRTLATGQQPMPDADHAVAFWRSVATAFKGNSAVIFDLFNEPYPDNNSDSTAAWTCWRQGGTCAGVPYQVAGMQTLVTAVRKTGARNVIMLGGVRYANALSRWLTYEPHDPTGNLAASWHVYNFNTCNDISCYDAEAAPVAQKVPLIAGEIAENDCAHDFVDPLMSWLDAHKSSYLGWTWNTWDCSQGPALITDYRGTPTTFGGGLKAHLAALAARATAHGTACRR